MMNTCMAYSLMRVFKMRKLLLAFTDRSFWFYNCNFIALLGFRPIIKAQIITN